MNEADIAEVMAKPIAQQLLNEVPVLHLAYTGLDGAPRAIPFAYLWDGVRFQLWTIPNSPKVRAMRRTRGWRSRSTCSVRQPGCCSHGDVPRLLPSTVCHSG